MKHERHYLISLRSDSDSPWGVNTFETILRGVVMAQDVDKKCYSGSIQEIVADEGKIRKVLQEASIELSEDMKGTETLRATACQDSSASIRGGVCSKTGLEIDGEYCTNLECPSHK